MIEIKDKKDCVGCTACAGICPKKCIQMKPDEEGFLYPVVDKSRCVECNDCNTVCPIQNPVTEEEKPQKAYLLCNKPNTRFNVKTCYSTMHIKMQ